MKAQSDLTGDRESATEMTAPRICAVTTWMDTINSANGFMVDLMDKPTMEEAEAMITAARFTPDLSKIADTLENKYFDFNFSEVTPLPPAAVTPRAKSR